MALTYINLVNGLLRRFHQAEITSVDFASPAAQVHRSAKDAIVNAVDYINNQVDTWPFNASTGSILCVPGQSEYDAPANMKAIDWRTFRMHSDDSLNVGAYPMEFMQWDAYNRYFYSRDNEASTADYAAPKYVYRTLSNNIGITPIPDEAYSLSYMYYMVPASLTSSTDQTNIPDRFRYAILDRASIEFCDSRGDIEGQNKYYRASIENIRAMRKQLINDDMDTMLTNMSAAARTGNVKNSRYLRVG